MGRVSDPGPLDFGQLPRWCIRSARLRRAWRESDRAGLETSTGAIGMFDTWLRREESAFSVSSIVGRAISVRMIDADGRSSHHLTFRYGVPIFEC